jgi:hypothetical protein
MHVYVELVLFAAGGHDRLILRGKFLDAAQQGIGARHPVAGDGLQTFTKVAIDVFGDIAAGKEDGKPGTEYLTVLVTRQTPCAKVPVY